MCDVKVPLYTSDSKARLLIWDEDDLICLAVGNPETIDIARGHELWTWETADGSDALASPMQHKGNLRTCNMVNGSVKFQGSTTACILLVGDGSFYRPYKISIKVYVSLYWVFRDTYKSYR